jgi:nucleoside 2-deoxyribosyltransferase
MVDIGIEPYAPLDRNGLRGEDATKTARKDLNDIAASGAVLVLADHARTGPWVETGWALRHGVPVVVFTEDTIAGRFTMADGGGGDVVHDIASAVYRAGWAALAART